MHIGPHIKNVKLMTSGLLETIRETQKTYPNTSYNTNATLTIVAGVLTDSETISFLDKLNQAVSKFGEDTGAKIQLECIPQHAANSVIEETLGKRLTASLELAATVDESKKIVLAK